MIAKGKAIAHGCNAINYALREGKLDSIISGNMIENSDPANILREFEMVNQHNYRCKNKYLRFEIGIAPQDKDKLSRDDVSKIARTFAAKMGLQNHQWIACTHKDTNNLHIHLIANRIGIDGKVFDTTFMSNRSARIAEEISRDMNLTIANNVRREKQHQEVYTDPARQQAKEKLQQIAYSELHTNTTLENFLRGMERRGVSIEAAKNKQGDTFGLRFSYHGQTFKASEIGREFGLRSIEKNFTETPHQASNQRVSHTENHSQSTVQHHSVGGSILSLLLDIASVGGHTPPNDYSDIDITRKKKKRKKRLSYGRQQ